MAWLKSNNNPSIFNLNINCRNTHNILAKIQSSLTCDLGKPALIEGPEVTEFSGDKFELSQKLSELLSELNASELDDGSITILSTVRKRKSLLSLLSLNNTKEIIELDDYKIRSHPFSNITFAQIADFKGLENHVIILLDLQNSAQLADEDEKLLHYVGMSRVRSKLYCFWNEDS